MSAEDLRVAEAKAKVKAKAISKLATKQLLAAVERGDLPAVKRAINAGADVDARAKWDMTPLLTACHNGFLNVAKALVKAGANTRFRNKHQWTALTSTVHGAAMAPENTRGVKSPRGHAALLKFLLARGGDPRERHKGDTLLELAESGKYCSPRPEKLIPILKKAITDTRGAKRTGKASMSASGSKTTSTAAAKSKAKSKKSKAKAKVEAEVIPETYDVDVTAPFTPPNLSVGAKSPAFREAVADFTRRFGQPVYDTFEDDDAGVIPVFTTTQAEAAQVVAREQAKRMKQGVFVCRTGDAYLPSPPPRGRAHLALFPTGDVIDAMAAAATGGGFEGVGAAVTRFKRIMADDPFRLSFISEDTAVGEFLRPPKDAMTLAERLEALCPGAAGDDDDDLSPAAERLKKSRRLFLWWD
jgi:hypothetical protein